MVTAGITDANVKIVAPYKVSGTAALTGIYMAYEDITGKKLDEDAKLVGTKELTITAELADEIGSADSTAIVNELKLILDQKYLATFWVGMEGWTDYRPVSYPHLTLTTTRAVEKSVVTLTHT